MCTLCTRFFYKYLFVKIHIAGLMVEMLNGSSSVSASLVANCHKQTIELENDYGVPFPV